jgi:PHD/YefM family antitoxin component YafN of YafNO toxin-antitoxin module
MRYGLAQGRFRNLPREDAKQETPFLYSLFGVGNVSVRYDILVHMIKPREQYVVSGKGRKVAVLLPVSAYRKLVADLEELEAIRAYDAAKASRSKAIPFKQAKQELRRRK